MNSIIINNEDKNMTSDTGNSRSGTGFASESVAFPVTIPEKESEGTPVIGKSS